MPKVNSRFFVCPSCGECIRFIKQECSVFLYDEEDPLVPGLIYENEVVYKCLKCGYIVTTKKE